MTDFDQNRSQEPIWKRDFPYTSEGEEEVTRREFARYAVLASVAFAGGSTLVGVWTSLLRANVGEPRPILAAADIEVGGSHLFSYPTEQDPAILVRLSEAAFIAFGQKCTHLGCVVFWVPAEDEFHCPCHDGVFDGTGQPVAGPPTRALTRIEVENREGTVWALGIQTGH